MTPLIIQESQSTPKIVFDTDKNKFEITGNSLPEDVMDFYGPVYQWLREYIHQPNSKTEVTIKLLYCNSSSSKVLLDLLTLFDQIAVKGYNVEVNWYYLEMDEDMLSTGKEYESMLSVPFNFYTYIQEQ
jgi:hypothetical protein